MLSRIERTLSSNSSCHESKSIAQTTKERILFHKENNMQYSENSNSCNKNIYFLITSISTFHITTSHILIQSIFNRANKYSLRFNPQPPRIPTNRQVFRRPKMLSIQTHIFPNPNHSQCLCASSSHNNFSSYTTVLSVDTISTKTVGTIILTILLMFIVLALLSKRYSIPILIMKSL